MYLLKGECAQTQVICLGRAISSYVRVILHYPASFMEWQLAIDRNHLPYSKKHSLEQTLNALKLCLAKI